MTERTLSDYDQLRLEQINNLWPVDNVAAMEEITAFLLEKDAAIAAVERKLEFAKEQIRIMEKKNAELEAKLKNDH